MRLTPRQCPRLAAALALAALLATTTSCAGPGGPTFSPEYLSRPPEAVSVVVSYDAGQNKAVMANKWVILRGGKDSVHWISPDGELEVAFEKGSPFERPPSWNAARKALESPPARRVTEKRIFDYTARLKLPNGTTVSVDPRVEIWP